MIGHRRYRTLVPWRQYLSIRQQTHMVQHLEQCEQCRLLEEVVAWNRSRLRSLQGLRPPDDVRRAVLTAAEKSEEAGRVYGPLVVPFALMPAVLTTLVLFAIYGRAALVGLLVIFSLLVIGAGIQERRNRENVAGRDRQPWMETLGTAAQAIIVDVIGILVGAGLLLLLTYALWFIMQHE